MNRRFVALLGLLAVIAASFAAAHPHAHNHAHHQHDHHHHHNEPAALSNLNPAETMRLVQRAFRVAQVMGSNKAAALSPEQMFELLQETACQPKCPACGMSVSSAKNRLHITNNQYMYFCSAGCRDKVLQEPDTYLLPTNSLPIPDCFLAQEHHCPVCNMDTTVSASTKHIEWAHGQRTFVCDMTIDHSQTMRQNISKYINALPTQCQSVQCPVCKMSITPGASSPTVEFDNGQVVSTCSTSCQTKLLQKPQDYVDPSNGGGQNIPPCDDGNNIACPACNDRFLARSTTPALVFQGGQRVYSCSKSDGSSDLPLIKADIQHYISTPIPPVDDDDDDDGDIDPPTGSRCPVCGMDLPSDPVYQGLNYGQAVYFCSTGCKDNFVADPTRYFGSSGGGGSGGHSMAMYFISSTSATILFKEWEVSSATGYGASIVAVFAMCLAHELIAALRHALYVKVKDNKPQKHLMGPVGAVQTLSSFVLANGRAVLAILYTISSITSLCLMLIAMTFNTGLFLTIVAGMGTGWYLFGFNRGPASSDTCCADYNEVLG